MQQSCFMEFLTHPIAEDFVDKLRPAHATRLTDGVDHVHVLPWAFTAKLDSGFTSHEE